MSTVLAARFKKPEHAVMVAAAIASLVLSSLSINQDVVISPDGILYLKAAEAFSEGGLSAAYALYPWPFFSWLIHLVHGATGIDLELSAQLINSVFFAITVVMFIALVKALGGEGVVLIAAAIVVLAFPKLNDYRSFIVRDSGYWAFYLTAILLFISYFRHPNWKHAIAWVIAMFAATLFRIEGVIFLAMLPLALLFKPDSRARLLVRAYAPHLVLVLVCIGLYWAADWRQTGRLLEPVSWVELLAKLGMSLDMKADALSAAILNRFSDHMAVTALISALIGILLVTVVKGITLPYVALALHAKYSRAVSVERGARNVLIFVAVLNLLILAAYLPVNFFLTGRFIVALSLIVILAVPFSLAVLFTTWRERAGSRWLFPPICVVLMYMAADGMVSFGPSNIHLKDAGLWIKDNTPAYAVIYADDQRVPYYAGERSNIWKHGTGWDQTQSLMSGDEWKSYDYLAVEISRKNPEREKWVQERVGSEPVARFGNERKDQIVIFKVKEPPASRANSPGL